MVRILTGLPAIRSRILRGFFEFSGANSRVKPWNGWGYFLLSPFQYAVYELPTHLTSHYKDRAEDTAMITIKLRHVYK
jgi:hypothetical protein